MAFWNRFDEFVGDLRRRMEIGAAEYGDMSFQRPASEIASELKEEALDIAGWGAILWERVEKLEQRILLREAFLAELDREIEARVARLNASPVCLVRREDERRG